MSDSVARLETSVGAVPADQWDALDASGNPFTSHAFLSALEDSGSVGGESGWSPAPILIDGADGRLAAALPAYIKDQSQGEYVFDHPWADAWHRAGGRYYPKLQIAAPFTPATGPRLLTRDPALALPLLRAAEALCKEHGLSSAHATFIEPAQLPVFEAAGWLLRSDIQFHWTNNAYASFDDFLRALSSDKRKNLRKERASAQDGVTIRRLRGPEILDEHWHAFWHFYQDTGARKWGRPYLTREAFSLLSERMGDKVLLILALMDGEPLRTCACTTAALEWGTSPCVGIQRCPSGPITMLSGPKGLPRTTRGIEFSSIRPPWRTHTSLTSRSASSTAAR